MLAIFSRKITVALALCVTTFWAHAHDFSLGNIQIGHPYARATVAQQSSGGAYLSLTNKGAQEEQLIKVSSPIAKTVEIHTMSMSGDVMKMRSVENIVIKAGEKIAMQPGGGFHIMLIGLNQALKAGDHFPLTLEFAKAGKIEVTVNVEAVSTPLNKEHNSSAHAH